MTTYDYTIVGGGPAGLTCAYYLAKNGKNVLLIERESSLGGCHRVQRMTDKKLFCEHGPRIIIDNYFSLINMLEEFQKDLSDPIISFYNMYTPYDFSTNTSAKELFTVLSFRELFVITIAFLRFSYSEEWSKNISVLDFATQNNFSRESNNLLDKICRLSDGGTSAKYTLYEFLQIFNQNFFYTIYQPKLPNDVGLFKIWEKALLYTKNVKILLNTEIDSIFNPNTLVLKGGDKINSSNIIFAIPPTPMMSILNNSKISSFSTESNVQYISKESEYLVYLPVTFHWDKKLELPRKHPLPESYYGIVYVTMSDYMKFDSPYSLTVIVCTAKSTDTISPRNNKTANQCNKEELIEEIYLQLCDQQPKLKSYERPNYAFLDPNVYKETSSNLGNEKWNTKDTAFFLTKYGYIPNTTNYDNIWWVGTHNGNSRYSFTSMESAMQNAIYLLNTFSFIPRIETKSPFSVTKPLKIIGWLIIIGILILIAVSLYYFFKRNGK